MRFETKPRAAGISPVLASPLQFRSMTDGCGSGEREAELTTLHRSNSADAAELEAARQEGRREAELDLLGEVERRVQAERQSVASVVEGFVAEKRRYFAEIEKEVVRLSLAIAERVIHREAAMDPSFLMGAARVALEQVDQGSTVVLKVHSADLSQWETVIAGVGRELTLRNDPLLQRGRCLLETDAGSFEIGVRAQLCEIERGFFDLLGRAPAAVALV